MNKKNHDQSYFMTIRRILRPSRVYSRQLPPPSYRRNIKSSRSVKKKIITTAFCLLILSMMGLYTAFSIVNLLSLNNSGEEIPVDPNKKVAAFYYGWYSNSTDYSQMAPIVVEDDTSWRHWGIGDPNANNEEAESRWTPYQGWFDSADPTIIETHLRQAEWAGIDAFIVSFWGTGRQTYETFKTMLRVANQIGSKLKFTLYLETSRYRNLENSEVIDQLIPELEYIYDFFTDRNQNPEKDFIWFQDGKPVLFIYITQFIEEVAWITSLNNLASKGKYFFLNAGAPGTSPTLNNYFQGAHNYGIYIEMLYNTYNDRFLTLKTQCTQFNQLFCAGVGPGYDDTYVREGNPPLDRYNGDTYRDCWENALALNPDWITICSWNEWHEGSQIEPSVENGDLALRQTKTYIKKFKENALISMYSNTNYEGNRIILGVGNYPDITDVGMLNDVLSSIIIADGLEVILYQDYDYGGPLWILNNDISSLASIGANDKASSIKVRYINGEVINDGDLDITFMVLFLITIGAFMTTGIIGSIKLVSNNRNNRCKP